MHMKSTTKQMTAHFSLLALLALQLVGFVKISNADALRIGMWNTHLGQVNVLECNNAGAEEARFSLTLRAASGASINTAALGIPAGATQHFLLSQLGLPSNQFGTFSLVEASGGALSDALYCVVMIYGAVSQVNNPVPHYAISLPVEAASNGPLVGLYNTYNPNGSGQGMQNWLAVSNYGAQEESFTLRRWNSRGELVSEIALNSIAPAERRDVLVAEPAVPEAGIFELSPSNNQAQFVASLVRYQLDSAFPILAVVTSPIPAQAYFGREFASTTLGAQNWFELANYSQSPQTFNVRVRNFLGQMLGERMVSLNAYASQHLYLNDFLGPQNLGVVAVEPESGAGAVFASLHYGVNSFRNVRWAYAGRGRVSDGAVSQVIPLNTFLDAFNWQKYANIGETNANLSVFWTNAAGLIAGPQQFFFAADEERDLFANGNIGNQQVGFANASNAAQEASFLAQGLRVYPDANGEVATVAAIPAGLVNAEGVNVKLTQFVGGLQQPLEMVNAGDQSNRLFVLEKAGRIRIIESGQILSQAFLDISTQVNAAGEQGLLGLAFAPDYETSRYFYVHYNTADRSSTISRFRAQIGNPRAADTSSEQIILQVPQPAFNNHKGGSLVFGPDGFLYLALGDGGSAGDPLNSGQDLQTLLGKILRLDVSNVAVAGYSIPPGNPFVSSSAVRPEIWAYGLRNPYKAAFDFATGRFFAGDVGQGAREEVDLIEAGKNYGWKIMEGSNCFSPASNCNRTGLTLPIAEYDHSEGTAIIGGYVYRGQRYPSMRGKYFFADFTSGRIWTLSERADGTWERRLVYKSTEPLLVSSFGEDEQRELYIVDITGVVYRIEL